MASEDALALGSEMRSTPVGPAFSAFSDAASAAAEQSRGDKQLGARGYDASILEGVVRIGLVSRRDISARPCRRARASVDPMWPT
jgi:hypothetical protein